MLLGLFSGCFYGYIDTVVNLAVNVWMGFPFILLAMVLVSVLGQSEANIIFAPGVTICPVFCRVVRVEVMTIVASVSMLKNWRRRGCGRCNRLSHLQYLGVG